MSKRISILLLTIAFLSQANAQTQKRAIEFELAAGGIIASDKMFFQKNNIGLSPSLELRYNFRQVPVDLGLQWSAQVFSRTFRPYDHLGFLSQNITLTSDYNFRKCKHISFFAGLGAGIALIQNGKSLKRPDPESATYIDGAEGNSFCIMPRIGMEFWDRIRLTLSYKYEDKANRHLGLYLGFVIGGGNKK